MGCSMRCSLCGNDEECRTVHHIQHNNYISILEINILGACAIGTLMSIATARLDKRCFRLATVLKLLYNGF